MGECHATGHSYSSTWNCFVHKARRGPEFAATASQALRHQRDRCADRERAGTAARACGSSAPSPPPQQAPAPIITQPVRPLVQAVPPGPPQKDLTSEEFGFIHVGSTVKEVLKALGPPSSRVVVPDDDGHLRESLQYWVKGSPMAMVRMDN